MSGTHDLSAFVARLFEEPDLLRMGHNQRADDKNLGLGWLYYALGRLLRPARAVVIGSYRGFVPLVLGRALADNAEPGEVTFIDPSMVDDFWKNPTAVRRHFEERGAPNVRHFCMTTQAFAESREYRDHGPVGLLFVDGHHSAEQARVDHEAFRHLMEPRGIVLFHDSMTTRRSTLYGESRAYQTNVFEYLNDLKRDPSYQVFDVPFGPGLTLVRRVEAAGDAPFYEGLVGLERAP